MKTYGIYQKLKEYIKLAKENPTKYLLKTEKESILKSIHLIMKS
jgi:hypothetical protein